MTFEELFEQHWEWAGKTFDTQPSESTKGLVREANELDFEFNKEYDDPEFEIKSLTEIADCFMYLVYIMRKQGWSYEQVKNVFAKKLEINKSRTWKKDETGCYSHVKQV